jgi:uncharacterized membrane protein
MFIKRAFIISLAVVYAACTNDKAVNTPQPGVYFPKVKAIIQANCITCHQPGGEGMPLFFTSDAKIVASAANIKAATIDPVSPRNKRMPLGGNLSAADTTAIGRWFAKGGKTTD